MRLVIDGHRLAPTRTGVGRALELVLASWARTGPPIEPATLILAHRDAERALPPITGLQTRVIMPRAPGIVRETLGLGGFLEKDDILLAPAGVAPWFPRVKTVLVVYDLLHHALPNRGPRLRGAWQALRSRRAAERAERILVPSLTTRDDMITHWRIDPERIRVAPLAPAAVFALGAVGETQPALARSAVGLGARDRFILFVGKRSDRRNIPLIVSAFARVRARFADCRLVFAGPPGPDSASLAQEPGVVVAGFVTEPVLAGLYAGAECLIHVSEHEGFGLPLVEAMACGCPVIALRTRVAVEVGGAALLSLESLDGDALAGLFATILGDRDARAVWARRALERSRSFDRAAFAGAIDGAIRELAGP